jgi:ADP-heptose:LPS heptosyltransferase
MERGKFQLLGTFDHLSISEIMAKKNLLIIHQGALGDFILTFPALIRLRKYYGVIDVLCQSGIGKLANALGLVEKWYPLEAAYVASLFTDRIDSKIKTLLARYANIILFTLSDQLEQTIRHLASVSACCIPPKPMEYVHIHLTEFVLKNLINCGLIKSSDAVFDDIPLPNRRGQPKNGDRILLHPGAGSKRKRWSISNFLEVEAVLRADGLKPEFILGPAEDDLVDALTGMNRTVHILTDLTELAALLKSAGGYIGNDSGASHLAAFLGLPATVIFGPADPKRWTPVGRNVAIVRPELECRPCFETEKTNCGDPECLTKTTPQQVIRAFYREVGGF